MPKITVRDVALYAGVSSATVDRALHGRGGVSQASLKRISEAVEALNFGGVARELTHQMRPKFKLRFIVPGGGGGFILNIKNALRAATIRATDFDIIFDFRAIEIASQSIVDELNKALFEGIDGVGLFTMDTIEVRDAIDANVDAGMPVVTMVSDVPAAHRTTFIGIDNDAAGRTAGRLMGKFLRGETGRVAVIAGSMQVRDHLERFFAFRDTLARDYRNIGVLPVYETRSLDRYNLECVQNLMETCDDLLGIYLVTGGVSGVLAGLRERPRSKRPVFIAHDITPTTRRGLISGEIDAIINQNAEEIANATVDTLLAKLVPNRHSEPVSKASIGIDIFVAENLP